MSYNTPWIRNIEVIIGPFSELDQTLGPPKSNGKRIFSDGTPAGLRVRFSVRKHIVSTGSPTTIGLYNLSESTRNSIKNKLTAVTLNVGYANIPGMRTLFTGSILSCFSSREGADIVTNISALQHYGGLNQICKVEMVPDENGIPTSGQVIRGDRTVAWMLDPSKQSKLADVVRTLWKSIPIVADNPAVINLPDTAVSKTKWTFHGTIANCLNKLAREHGFSWFVDNGVFYATTDDTPFDSNPVVISTDNGYLIRAEPMFYGPAQGEVGVSITSVLNPLVDIKPGARVVLKSTINTNLNNATNPSNPDADRSSRQGYIVTDLTHSGDSHSSQWQTHMECRFMGVRR